MFIGPSPSPRRAICVIMLETADMPAGIHPIPDAIPIIGHDVLYAATVASWENNVGASWRRFLPDLKIREDARYAEPLVGPESFDGVSVQRAMLDLVEGQHGHPNPLGWVRGREPVLLGPGEEHFLVYAFMGDWLVAMVTPRKRDPDLIVGVDHALGHGPS